ncbi:hypothetical protein M2275_007785 [Rhodococcus opacus]|nr:hypothetical protein [Rhodococcus opacus]
MQPEFLGPAQRSDWSGYLNIGSTSATSDVKVGRQFRYSKAFRYAVIHQPVLTRSDAVTLALPSTFDDQCVGSPSIR